MSNIPTMTVWKFPLPLPEGPSGTMLTLELPAGATILKIAEQGRGNFFLWALVCTSVTKKEKRLVLPVGTGHEFSAKALADIALIAAEGGKVIPFAHQETVLAVGGSFVVHFWVSYLMTEAR